MKNLLLPILLFLLAACQKEKIPPMITFTYEITENGTLTGAFSSETVTYQIDFGDGSAPKTGKAINNVPTEIVHKYTQKGTFTITITANNENGTASQKKEVKINSLASKPNAAFTYTLEGNGTVIIVPQINMEDIVVIDFGDGNSMKDTVLNTTSYPHQYTKNGSYTILLSIQNIEGVDKSTQTVVINDIVPPPIADFSYQILDNGKVQFTNLSKNAHSYNWNIGYYVTNKENPSVEFDINQHYTIELRVSNNYGSSYISKNISVTNCKEQMEFVGKMEGVETKFTIDNKNFILGTGFNGVSGMPYQFVIGVYDNKLNGLLGKIYKIELTDFDKKYSYDGQYCCPSSKELYSVIKNKILNDSEIIEVKEEDLNLEFYNIKPFFYPKALWVKYKVKNEKFEGYIKVRILFMV